MKNWQNLNKVDLLTKQLWVRLTQQFFFSSSDVNATRRRIVALDGPIIALLIIRKQQEATPSNHNA
jgi:hypothetical protein